MTAGTAAAHRAHTGSCSSGTSHGRPHVVPNLSGTDRHGSATAYRALAAAATATPPRMPRVGAKSEMAFRARLRRYGLARAPRNAIAPPNVVRAAHSEVKAYAAGTAGERNKPRRSEAASKMKMAEMRLAKISSVNRVSRRMALDADVNDDTARNPDDHSPTHA